MSFFSQNDKMINSIQVSGNEATKNKT